MKNGGIMNVPWRPDDKVPQGMLGFRRGWRFFGVVGHGWETSWSLGASFGSSLAEPSPNPNARAGTR